ncbi:MAG TPA: sensor histidine kinase [Jatrophihabitans sp.]|jgi:two-component system sensor histidine kinase DesK
MNAVAGPVADEEHSTLVEASQHWGVGWRRYFFPAFWLVYLGQAVDGVAKHSTGAAAVAGYVIVVAFAAAYLVALPLGWDPTCGRRLFWALYATAIGLTVAESFFAGSDALVFCVYVAVLTVAACGRSAIPIVLVITAACVLAPRFVPGWGHRFGWNIGLTVFLVAFAMFGFFMIIRNNIALTAARAEVARLAAENERTRIARDLHDLLGHSLTTITVKAGLARRLSAIDPDRAAGEIAAVEQLARRTLGEVRAAVAGYRDLTLTGELASAHEVLRASGIEARLPGAVDAVDPDAVEPFGWVVREAVTNVVRHSRATSCTVTVGPRWIEITDDGRGSGATGRPGSGLAGLRERLAHFGGTLHASGSARGWTLRAELAPVATERARVDA